MRSAKVMNAVLAGPFSYARLNVPNGSPQQITLSGELGRRLARSIHRIEAEAPYCTEFLLSQISAAPGAWCNFPRFHGDMCGRWILAETHAHAAAGRPPTALADLVSAAIALQNPDGSFGAISSAVEPLNREKAYGNGWMLRGLTTYAQVFADPAARAAAIRLGEHYLASAPAWFASNESERDTGAYAATISCFYHGLDGLVALARLTGDDRYRDLGRRFLPRLTRLEQADHSHMYLTIRRGVLGLLQDAGDKTGLAGLAADLDQVWATCALETGGMPERFGLAPGQHADDEGCTLFDWEILTTRLFAATGEIRWMERAILNLENHIGFNQCYNGGFGSCELGHLYKQQGKEAPWCCSLAGPFGLIDSAAGWVRLDGTTLEVNHLVSGTMRFADGSEVVLERDDANARYRIDLSRAPRIAQVALLRPHWLGLEATGATVVGARTLLPRGNGALELAVAWQLWASLPGRAPAPVAASDGTEVVLFYGPWILAHRHHDGPVPVTLRRDGVGRLNGWNVSHLQGLTYAGEGFRISMPMQRQIPASDVFRGVDQAPGQLWAYPLKDKESPCQMRTRVVLRLV